MEKELHKKGIELFKKYQNAKREIDERIIEEERLWQNKDTKNVSQTWNAIVAKHADLMDSYPEATFLPREESDIDAAKTLSKVVSVILKRNDFEVGIFWDPTKENGMGDITIRHIDLLNIFFDITCRDIENSEAVFIASAIDKEKFTSLYPLAELPESSRIITYSGETDADKVVIIDWYYKKRSGAKTVLHFVKMTEKEILYASELDAEYRDTGYYEHGHYPIVLDTLYPTSDKAVGYGLINVTKEAQGYIDILDTLMLSYAKKACVPRWFKKRDVGISEAEFADWSKPFVTVAGSIEEEKFRQISLNPIPQIYYNIMERKIQELKETSGNRDFNQGGTMGGVTSGTAIATLQEAGNKMSRDVQKGSYRAFRKLINIMIEIIRQFYDEFRTYRIVGENEGEDFIAFSNDVFARGTLGGEKKAIFDIDVSSEKANPYSKLASNEMAANLYKLGVFNPDKKREALILLDMMDFDGKSAVINKLLAD